MAGNWFKFIDAKSWSFETDLVVNRFRFAASAWRNQFFIFGGQSGSVNESFPVLNTVTSYEGKTKPKIVFYEKYTYCLI